MATETVSLVFTFKGGRLVGAGVDRLGKKFKKLRAEMTLTQRIAKSLRGTLSTISKALISGIAITAVFGTVFGAINMVRRSVRALKDELVAGVMAVGDFQEQTLTLTGVIATTVKYSEDLEKNFKKAGQTARTVQLEFLKRTGEIIGTSQDAALVFQTLLGQGVAGLVDNMQEAVDLSILFTNAIIAVTPGQDKQRQLASETAAFLRGQVRATDRLAKLLGYSAADLTRIRDNAKDAKDFFQQIQPRLEAIERASKEFGNTWTGLVTSSKDLVKILRLRVFTQLFEGIRSRFQTMRDFVLEHIDEIGDKLAPIAALLVTAFDNLETIMVRWFNNSSTLESMVDSFVYSVVVLGAHINNWIEPLERAWYLAGAIGNTLGSIGPSRGGPDTGPYPTMFSQTNWDEAKQDWKTYKELLDKKHLNLSVEKQIAKTMEEIAWNRVVQLRQWEIGNREAADLKETLTPMRDDTKSAAKAAKAFADQMARVEDMRAGSKASSLQNVAPNMFPFADIDLQMGKLADSIAVVFKKQGVKEGSKDWLEMEETLKRLTKQRYLERISETTKEVNKQINTNVIFWARVEAGMKALKFPEHVLVAVAEYNRLIAEGILGKDMPERLRKFVNATLKRAKFQAKTGALGIDIEGGPDPMAGLLDAQERLTTNLQDPTANWSDAALMEMTAGLEGVNEMITRINENFMRMSERAWAAFEASIMGAEKTVPVLEKAKRAATVLIAGMAEGLANMLVGIFEGSESIISGLGKLVGQLLVQLGTFLVTAGAMAVAAGTLGGFFPFLRVGGLGGPEGIPSGVIAMAVGTAAIAAGVAMGGAGGGGKTGTGGAGGGSEAGMTTYMVDQKDVSVNAAINSGITALNTTMGNMKAASPGDVWTVGAKENGGVMTVASKEATGGATASQTQSLGGSVTGGRG